MLDILNAFAKIPADEHVVFEVKRRIMNNTALLPMAQQIIGIWYTGEFVGPDGKVNPATQEQYYGGRIWDVILARHAPTNSKENYGYWAKPPDAERVKKQRG